MQIISGLARGVSLEIPEGLSVRPTAVRARKALLDSIGDLSGFAVSDIFAGSGALGLEAASRGAASVSLVDSSPASCDCIRRNCAKVQKAGVQARLQLVEAMLPGRSSRLLSLQEPDFILADPPYDQSGRLFTALLEHPDFNLFASKSLLVWELPDGGLRIDSLPKGWRMEAMRQFGAAKFMLLRRIKAS